MRTHWWVCFLLCLPVLLVLKARVSLQSNFSWKFKTHTTRRTSTRFKITNRAFNSAISSPRWRPSTTSLRYSSFCYFFWFLLLCQSLFSFSFLPPRSPEPNIHPLEDNMHKIFLGPMGDSDPSMSIIIESNRIPFKHSNIHPNLWDKKTSIRN